MALTINFQKTPRKGTETAVIFVFENRQLGKAAHKLDQRCAGFIAHAMKKSSKFKGKHGQSLSLSLPAKAPYSRVLLAGLGKPQNLTALKAEEAGGKVFAALSALSGTHAALIADTHEKLKEIKGPALSAHFALGLRLRAYRFDKYKTKKKSKDQPVLSKLTVIADNHTAIAKIYKPLGQVSDGMYMARDLVNEPPNMLYPDAYARRIRDELKPLGVSVEILDEKKMQRLGMGAILAVGMGSEKPPRMVIMHWNGSGKNKNKKSAPLALVGKGVTFDTGGISIKPGGGMDEMKMDMAGSAAVVGVIKALALRKSKANVVGIVGLAENMPSSKAYRPADVVTSYAGKTIEVLNTDAEGRMVLVDALAYVQKTYKPKTVIDLATLTGAMMVALAHEYCGTFVNSDKLWAKLENASRDTGEKLWRMPLDEVWKKDMEGTTGDLQNLGKSRYGGACTAAGFLEHFIEDKIEWAHMDIAGTAWIKSPKPTVPKYGTGFGVRVLDRFVADHYE